MIYKWKTETGRNDIMAFTVFEKSEKGEKEQTINNKGV